MRNTKLTDKLKLECLEYLPIEVNRLKHYVLTYGICNQKYEPICTVNRKKKTTQRLTFRV